MKTRSLHQFLRFSGLAIALAVWPIVGNAQVATAEIEPIEELPTLSSRELEEVIGPIALYPDDLLAIVLPASTFPLQIVEAARFLDALEDDPALEPDADWDDSVVALTNYPEVIALLNEDLDWTWRLGEAVVAQQADVIAAIELFRDRAYAAGNLKSDDYQLVAHEGGAIQITPVEEDVIYVPYYEPERVVVYQPRPVYYYYPRPYPVYYYPYPRYHAFYDSYFWGVTTAFTIGWHSHHLNVFHHSYWGHPYYGRSYWDRWWYRRPDIHVHNNVYVRNRSNVSHDRYRQGDRWRPNVRRTVRSSDQRVTRTRYYRNDDVKSVRNRTSVSSLSNSRNVARNNESRRDRNRDISQNTRRSDIQFRDRSGTPKVKRNESAPDRSTKFNRAKRDRDNYEPGISQRRSTARTSPTARKTVTRPTQPQEKAAPRQTQKRASPERQARQQSAPQRQTRPKASYERRSQPKAVQSRQQSAPKLGSAKSNRSRSTERIARNSQSRSPQGKRSDR
jgi:hypothetical protein